MRLALCLAVAGCIDEKVGVHSELIAGDLAPKTLSPTSILTTGGSAPLSYAQSLGGQRRFQPVESGETEISTSVTHWFGPGESPEFLRIPLEVGERAIVSLILYARPDHHGLIMDGFELLDSQRKPLESQIRKGVFGEFDLGGRSRGNDVEDRFKLAFPTKTFTIEPRVDESSVKSSAVLLSFPEEAQDHIVEVHVDHPTSMLALGAVVEASTYQPGDSVRCDFELIDESVGAARLTNVQAKLRLDDLPSVPLSTVVLTGNQRGYASVALSDAVATSKAQLELIATVEKGTESLLRSVVLDFDVVRPHAEIYDLHERMSEGIQGPQFEVDVTVRSLSADRFEVFGTLTGRAEAGYEVPVAQAVVSFDGVDNGLSTGTLVFDLQSVRDATVTGPFLLREVSLHSFYTGSLQHRVGLVEGVETPLTWGLAGNQALNDAMCNILAEAGQFKVGECRQ